MYQVSPLVLCGQWAFTTWTAVSAKTWLGLPHIHLFSIWSLPASIHLTAIVYTYGCAECLLSVQCLSMWYYWFSNVWAGNMRIDFNMLCFHLAGKKTPLQARWTIRTRIWFPLMIQVHAQSIQLLLFHIIFTEILVSWELIQFQRFSEL